MNKDLFKKYENIEHKSDGTLFGIEPIIALKFKKCPFCFNSLYEMRNKPFLYCKSNKHKNKFMVSKDKIYKDC